MSTGAFFIGHLTLYYISHLSLPKNGIQGVEVQDTIGVDMFIIFGNSDEPVPLQFINVKCLNPQNASKFRVLSTYMSDCNIFIID